jgi:hypothetical protein
MKFIRAVTVSLFAVVSFLSLSSVSVAELKLVKGDRVSCRGDFRTVRGAFPSFTEDSGFGGLVGKYGSVEVYYLKESGALAIDAFQNQRNGKKRGFQDFVSRTLPKSRVVFVNGKSDVKIVATFDHRTLSLSIPSNITKAKPVKGGMASFRGIYNNKPFKVSITGLSCSISSES